MSLFFASIFSIPKLFSTAVLKRSFHYLTKYSLIKFGECPSHNSFICIQTNNIVYTFVLS